MKRLLILLLLPLFAAAPGFAQSDAKLRRSPNKITGQYIVVLSESAVRRPGEKLSSKPRVPEVANKMAAAAKGKLLHVYEHALPGFTIRMTEASALAMASDPQVVMIEEDSEVQAASTQLDPAWGLDRIDQRNLPLDSSFTYNTEASDVHVFVLDSGIRATHVDFEGRIGAGYSVVNDGRGINDDCYGHGTHVTATIGGASYGVAKGVTLHPVRVLNCKGRGSWGKVIAGVEWVTANSHLRPAVANMSLVGRGAKSIDKAIRQSMATGVTYVVAAGNEGSDACNFSPARMPEVITVASTEITDVRWPFSNYGECVDLFAPGYEVPSAFIRSDTDSIRLDGTSTATPHVAGVAALYLASHPGASPAEVASAILCKATPNVVSQAGAGSPNLLLYSGLDDPAPICF